MKISNLTENKNLITEGWNNPTWTLFETTVIQPWVSDIEKYIVEAQLSADQINQLFTSVEQGATAAGGNRTAVGKGVDVAKLPVEAVKWINDKINELGKAVQDSGPVKNIDAKFNELKTKIGEKDSKVVQGVKAVSDWAKANPGKASVAVAILTIAASVAGGPLGGAIAGFLSRATKDLLQGEKLSTAAGKALKTAAIGWLAGKGIEAVGDYLKGVADAMAAPEVVDGGIGFNVTNIGNGLPSTYQNVDIIGTPQELTKLKNMWADAVDAWNSNNFEQATDMFTQAKEYAKDVTLSAMENMTPEQSAMYFGGEPSTAAKMIDGAITPFVAAAQGAASGSGGNKAESVARVGQKLSEGQVYLLFKKLEGVNTHMLENKLMFESILSAISHQHKNELTEGPLDALKKGAKAVGGAIKGAAKQVTTKVTAEKLNTAWKKAGSPTDSDEIYDIIKGMGVADDVIKGTYDSMQLKPPATTDAPDGDKDADAADQSTSDATDTTAGDAGGTTTTSTATAADKKDSVPSGDAGGNAKQTSEPVSKPTVGTTTSAGGGSTRSGAATPALGNAPDNVPGGDAERNIRQSGNPVGAPVNLPKLADQIKKAGPQVVRGVKELIAA